MGWVVFFNYFCLLVGWFFFQLLFLCFLFVCLLAYFAVVVGVFLFYIFIFLFIFSYGIG